jgi:hypothetical protein
VAGWFVREGSCVGQFIRIKMSVSINSINLKDEVMIPYREVLLSDNPIVRSINVNQIDGSFVTTEPLNESGRILIYPQSPNNPKYSVKTYNQLTGYGTLSLPTDARFNYINGTIWVADTGNSNVIRINMVDYSVSKAIKDIILPHSVIPDVNRGGVFIKAFSDINTGILYYYNRGGNLVDTFTYPCELGRLSVTVEESVDFINALPLSSSMVYDHVRSRLWWVSGSYVYLLDVKNKQVVENDLSIDYIETRSVDVDFSSGNAFVVAKDSSNDWNVVQIFRDNNLVFCNAYIEIYGTITYLAKTTLFSARNVYNYSNWVFLISQSSVRAYEFNGGSFVVLGNSPFESNVDFEDLWSDGDYIYCAAGGGSLYTGGGLIAYKFDGTFTRLDRIIDGIGTHGRGGNSVHGDGIYIYLANRADGIRAYTFNEIDGFINVGHSIDEYSSNIFCDASYIYTANGSEVRKLTVYTFNEIDGFINVGQMETSSPDSFRKIDGDGNYIYVAQGFGGLSAYKFNVDDGFSKIDNINLGACVDVWVDRNNIYSSWSGAGSFIGFTIHGINGNNFYEKYRVSSDSRAVGSDDEYIYSVDNSNNLNAYGLTY